MRCLTNCTKRCNQSGAGTCQDRANEGEARKGLFEEKGGKGGVKDKAGLGMLVESSSFPVEA